MRPEVAAELDLSFCGLPNTERGMTVFLSASDEAEGGAVFSHCGVVAPQREWSELFTPEWERRVISGPPEIPYFHMTSLRSREWRAEWGLTEMDAEQRIEEAVDVLCSMNTVFVFTVGIQATEYAAEIGNEYRRLAKIYPELKQAHLKAQLDKPDYQALVGYMLYCLMHVRALYPDATKLDFVIERKQKLSHWFKESHDDMPEMLEHIGHPDLIGLVGTLQDVKKEDQRRPVEAADLFAWYRQRADAGLILENTPDIARVRRLFAIHGDRFMVPREQLADLTQSLVRRLRDGAIT